MRYIVLLIIIVCFWFFLGTALSYVAADPVLAQASVNYANYSNATQSRFFNTTDDLDPEASAGGFFDMTIRMFTFRLPDMFPTTLNIFINFLNYFLLLLVIIAIYRIGNPLA